MSPPLRVAIVGAGLSGLALAERLRKTPHEVIVLEARDRAGGRVLSDRGYDLGPAWIWPHNHRMLALADRCSFGVFPQHSAGNLVFEDPSGHVRRDLSMATMGDALRVEGGLGRVIDVLSKGASDLIRYDHTVTQVVQDAGSVTLRGDGFTVMADQAVLALPPRLVSRMGVDVPDVPTWMAGHAKLIATYPTPFWRGQGLNGDAISHRGPLAEIHDASPFDLSEGALFGFIVPGAVRQPGFQAEALEQLERLFGPEAARPTRVLIQDWSKDAMTATVADHNPPSVHPEYRAIPSQGRIHFAGTETATLNGGFLEGALEAAETVFATLERRLP